MKRIYLDSNVFISLFNRELDPQLRGLFVEAEYFIQKIKETKSILFLSSWFFKEVKKYCFIEKEDVCEYFEKQGIILEIIEQKEISIKEFSEIGIHFPDSMHVAIAINQKCDCIVTFNIKDFEKAKDKIDVLQPLEFY